MQRLYEGKTNEMNFKELSIKEVRAMLDFDLSETKAGEELIEIGRKRRRKKRRHRRGRN